MDYRENSLDGEAMAHGNLSAKVYKEYLHHGANYFVLFLLVICFVISQIATSGNDYWVSYWTNLEEERNSETTADADRVSHQFRNMRNDSFLGLIFTLNPDGLLGTMSAIYVYTFTILALTILTLLRSFLFMKICMNSSISFHNTMFTNLLQTRMSFFNANPAGRLKYVTLSTRWNRCNFLLIHYFFLSILFPTSIFYFNYSQRDSMFVDVILWYPP